MATLKNDEARKLCKEGKEAWNKKIQSEGINEVIFTGEINSSEYQFEGYLFPAKTYFRDITFTGVSSEKTLN